MSLYLRGSPSMITIITMAMCMYLAEFVIEKMGRDDQDYGRDQQPGLVINKVFFGDKEYKTKQEKDKRHSVMMVFAVAMVEGIAANGKGKDDHTSFKRLIIDNIDPK